MTSHARCPVCNEELNLYSNKSPAYYYCPCGRKHRIISEDTDGLTFSKIQCRCGTTLYMEGGAEWRVFKSDEQMPAIIKIAMEFDRKLKHEETDLIKIAVQEAKATIATGIESSKKSFKIIKEAVVDGV